MDEQIRNKWLALMRGDAESRNSFYKFFETIPLLKGPDGVTIYKAIMGIALEAGAPREEVRRRLIPLLNQERPDVRLIVIGDNYLRRLRLKRINEKLKPGNAETEEKSQTTDTVPMKTLKDENRNAFFEAFSGGLKERERLYEYFETKEMRAIFKGPDCIAVYEEFIEIAEEAGVPREEVRDRVTPLLNEELLDAYTKKLVGEWMKGGGLERGIEQITESMKPKLEEKPKRYEPFAAYVAEKKRLSGS